MTEVDKLSLPVLCAFATLMAALIYMSAEKTLIALIFICVQAKNIKRLKQVKKRKMKKKILKNN